ncbi:hypothetical protein OPV22_014505 [Ensete ventricosum]|uniref:Uncharacterized protein n=1 Tax=Ensete ventricosum TaxID=4639 RepID=A0AAV8PQC2_ENSVE|nr:hypothetical protein OPV22_014505 [Ensete ventricosum]
MIILSPRSSSTSRSMKTSAGSLLGLQRGDMQSLLSIDRNLSFPCFRAGDEKKTISFDLRPSIWLFNARNLVYSDRMRVVKPSKLTMQGPQSETECCSWNLTAQSVLGISKS